ncbi:MAG: DUF3794 domain-containing protein [Clostridia bacterium]|nr:DUF3794 domain-containing protein [Clostridia bacterium]
MSIETLKESLCINQIIGKAKENIIAEGDVIIPDIKPDILSTINTNGTVCIYKKEVLDGRIRIDGGVQVYIMYLADDENGNIRGINTVIDFTKVIEMENVNSSMNIESNINLGTIECKILNGRKVNIKANIDIDVNIYSNENIEFIKNVENDDSIQVLNTSATINSLLGNGSTKVYAKDTMTIDNNDNLSEIMKVNLNLINKETKTSYNKILAKSDMQVNIMYLTEDNRVNEINWQIPVMGFIDMPDITDDNLCCINYEIKNCLLKPNSTEEHSIYIEVELEISCNVFEQKELNIIQDLYSPTENLVINQKNITVMQDKRVISDKCSVKEKMNIPELQNSKVCNTEIVPKIVKQNVYNDRIVLEGELQIKFIFISNITNRIDIKMQSIPFNTSIDCMGVSANSNIDTNIEIASQNIEVMPDGSIEANMELNIMIDNSKMTEVKVIDNIENSEDNTDNIYSIVVYFVKPGDTLWNIAKRFKSTINAIASVNGIEDENKINVGQQLFIPKFV